jgi:hypothetical protein
MAEGPLGERPYAPTVTRRPSPSSSLRPMADFLSRVPRQVAALRAGVGSGPGGSSGAEAPVKAVWLDGAAGRAEARCIERARNSA